MPTVKRKLNKIKRTVKAKAKKPAFFKKTKEAPVERTSKKIAFSLPLMVFLVVLLLVTFFIGTKFKGLVVVATVDGKPIYSWQFVNQLYKHYGARSLEDMVAEKLLLLEAEKEEITIPDEEIAGEVSQIEEQYGGNKAVREMLAEQRMDYDEFKKSVYLQLLTEKILEKRVEVTDHEVEVFVEQNESQMEAAGEAALRDEAREILKSQAIGEAYNTLFSDLHEANEIVEFLKF